MFKSFLLLAIRNFFKNTSYSIINIFGLSTGLAAFILTTLFVKFETSYDSFHKDHDRIYRVEQRVSLANDVDTWNQIPASVSTVLENNYPEIEEAITVREIWGEYLSTSKERTFMEPNGFYANPDVFDLFAFEFIAGNKETALDAPMKIVLTESVAKKLFPDSDPMGKSIFVDSKRAYEVSAIIEDYPFNTNTKLTYLIPFSTYKNVYNRDFFEEWDWHDTRVFLKLKENVDYKQFESKIKYLLDDFLEDRTDELYLNPIWKVRLRQGDDDGYWVAVILYGAVGFFTLILAAMNFINLTTAYSLTRAKEIGVKKIVGSSRFILMKQFLGESLVIVFISLLVALTIAEASLPLFNRIVSVPMDMRYIEDWQFTLIIIGTTALTGILSGLYPALILSSLNPLHIIKNQLFKADKFKKFSMRKGLVVFQLVLSVLFVITTLGVLSQFNYLKNKDLGFDKHDLFVSKIKETKKVKINEFAILREDLLKIPGVIDASVSYNSPFNGSWGRVVNWEGSQVGENMNCRFNRAYATFLNTMKIDLIAGRHFDPNRAADSAACIVNETFVKVIGWSPEDAIGKLVWDRDYQIIGVMKDFHEQSPFAKINPYILIHHPGYLTGWKNILIRVNDESNAELKGRIKLKLEDYFPESNFEVVPFNLTLDNNDTNRIYSGMAKTFGFFSVISIIIAVIGLFALVSFSSKRKVKEIGIRKVLGAKASQLFIKLAKEYFKLIIIANLIAIPFGIFMGGADPSYYKPEPSYSMFIWVSLSSIIVTIGTISIQIIKASRANPIESLRYE